MRTKLTILLLFITLASTYARIGYKQYYWGIKGGIAVPTNIGRDSEKIGFADVASAGINAAIKGGWFYNERLALGVEAGYLFFPKKDSFWNVSNRGDMSANYQSSNLLVSGTYFMADDGWKPYISVNFGMNYLRNMIKFESRYAGTDNDASVSYVYNEWKPGFGVALGTAVKISPKAEFVIEASSNIIPFLSEKVAPVVEDGTIVDYVTKNPHGNQNHFLITIGINFML